MAAKKGTIRRLSSREVAERIGVAPDYARRLIEQGAFGEAVNVAGPTSSRAALRVREDAVEAWIEERTVRAS